MSSGSEHLSVTSLSYHVTTMRDFNIYNRKWLVHSSSTSITRREAEQFAMVNDFFQLADLSTGIPDESGDKAHALHLTFTFTALSLIKYLHSSPSWLSGPLCYHILHQPYRPQPPDFCAKIQPIGTLSKSSWPVILGVILVAFKMFPYRSLISIALFFREWIFLFRTQQTRISRVVQPPI